MFTLYAATGSCSLASHIALAESGLPYAVTWLKMSEREQRSEAFLKLNPKGRVPVLVTNDGVLTETVAILAFIAHSAAETGVFLAPTDAFSFARMQSFNAYLATTVHVAHAHGRRGARWADEQPSHADMLRRVPGNMRECFRLIEDEFLLGPYVMGDNYTVADAYLFVMASWLASDGVDIAEFPRVADHAARISERPAVKRAQEEAAR